MADAMGAHLGTVVSKESIIESDSFACVTILLNLNSVLFPADQVFFPNYQVDTSASGTSVES